MVLLLLSLLVLSFSSLAAEHRIGPADGLQAAIDRLQPGDRLVLDAGDYTQSLVLNNVKGTANLPIAIDGQGAATVDPSSRDGVSLEGCEHIVLRGIRIRRAARAGILVHSSRHIAIRDCTVDGSGRWGIKTCLSDNVAVESCEISGSIREHGIYFSTTDRPTVRNSVIRHHASCGIHLNGDKAEGGDGMISGASIENNRIYENGKRGGAAINMDGVEHSTIARNTMYDNRAGGISSFVNDAARAGAGNRITDNEVRFRKGEGRYALQLMGGARATVVTGNRLCCGRGPVLELDEASIAGVTSDRNTFFAYGRRDVVGIGNERLTLRQWRRGSGQDGASEIRAFDDSVIRDGMIRVGARPGGNPDPPLPCEPLRQPE